MPVDPDSYKQDPRTPEELAKAILDHVMTPAEPNVPYSITFREQLLMDYGTNHQRKHPVLGKYGSLLLWTLKALEAGSLPNQRPKRVLSHALQVIDAYKDEAVQSRDDAARDAMGIDGLHGEFFKRAGAEEMETQMVAISNLKSIETLVRALAHNMGITLEEPERHK